MAPMCTRAVEAYYMRPAASVTSWSPVCCRSVSPSSWAGKSEDEIYGVGPLRSSLCPPPVIKSPLTARPPRVCGTARAPSDVETCGPVANWTWGLFAADFVRTEDGWKIWHLSYTNDVDCICGQSWGRRSSRCPSCLSSPSWASSSTPGTRSARPSAPLHPRASSHRRSPDPRTLQHLR